MNTTTRLFSLTLLIGLTTATGCDVGSDAPGAREDGAALAAIAVPGMPGALKADGITGLSVSCDGSIGASGVRLQYRASRDYQAQLVNLSISMDNGYLTLIHRRDGAQVATVKIDAVLGEPQRHDMAPGAETGAAYLMGELASAGIARLLPTIRECLSPGIAGQVKRGEDEYVYQPSCHFMSRALEDLTKAVNFTARTACCAAAPSRLSCQTCQNGEEIGNRAFASSMAPLDLQLCQAEDAELDGTEFAR